MTKTQIKSRRKRRKRSRLKSILPIPVNTMNKRYRSQREYVNYNHAARVIEPTVSVSSLWGKIKRLFGFILKFKND